VKLKINLNFSLDSFREIHENEKNPFHIPQDWVSHVFIHEVLEGACQFV
jgi:hypothetical protein